MKNLLYIICTIAVTSCATVSVQTEQEERDRIAINKQIEQKDLSLVATWAYPQADNVLNQLSVNNGLGAGNTAGRINLLGNTNYLVIKNDSVRGYLPYYGERRIVSGLNTSNAVEFSGIPDSYKVRYNEKKNRTDLSFTISEGSEHYDINLHIFNRKSVRIVVNSSHRVFIRYDAEIASSNDK